MSRFELNSSVKQLSRGKSLPKNQNINQAGFILGQKIAIEELQPRKTYHSSASSRSSTAEMWKGSTKTWNQFQFHIAKCSANQREFVLVFFTVPLNIFLLMCLDKVCHSVIYYTAMPIKEILPVIFMHECMG